MARPGVGVRAESDILGDAESIFQWTLGLEVKLKHNSAGFPALKYGQLFEAFLM